MPIPGTTMPNDVLVVGDADALIALAHQSDSNHVLAEKILLKLEKFNASIIYPATALAEAVTAAERKLADVNLATALLNLYADGLLIIAPVENTTLSAAAYFWQVTASKRDTFFDAIVCAVAQQKKADFIFSFDRGYTKQGFRLAKELL